MHIKTNSVSQDVCLQHSCRHSQSVCLPFPLPSPFPALLLCLLAPCSSLSLHTCGSQLTVLQVYRPPQRRSLLHAPLATRCSAIARLCSLAGNFHLNTHRSLLNLPPGSPTRTQLGRHVSSAWSLPWRYRCTVPVRAEVKGRTSAAGPSS